VAQIRDEANYLQQHDALPDDLEISPGVTAGQLRAMLQRPEVDPDGSRFVPSIAYSAAAGETGQMALYARRDAAERAPIVLFAHGGGFVSGHHFTSIRYMTPLAARGYVAATITYRFADEAPWPAAIEDAKCAVRWLRHHAHEIGGDPDRIVMAGESAGAHLSALMALTPGEYEGDGGWHDVSSEIQGAVLFYPPVDMPSTAALAGTKGDSILQEYFGDDIEHASPINRVSSACPPILTLTGADDEVTTVADISRFHDALDAAGVRHRLEVFPNAGHSFDFHPKQFQRCLALLMAFVEETVGSPLDATQST
jgi:acetyl esterase